MVNQVEAIVSVSLTQQSPGQIRRWRSTRLRAAASLVAAIGYDKPINDLSRLDALTFRQYWRDRVLRRQVQLGSANKMIGTVASMYRCISDHYQIDLAPVFDRLLLQGSSAAVRAPFARAFIQEQLLAEGAFDRLNPEARRILYLMIETGLRPSEACNLTRSTIILDHEIPHIRVLPEGRALKTKSSQRDIPLVGVSLMAMLAQQDGFPRYRDKSNSLSATLNKALLKKGLRSATSAQTLYSIRHSFSDRLRNMKAPDSTVDNLMGHSGRGPKYGEGIDLGTKLTWLSLIAFRPPSKV